MRAGERLHYMDNLRALAMLAGVLFHAALAYSPLAQPVFPTADRDNSVLVDVVAWLVHLFRMPLFFIVAGFFSALLVQRHGFAGMFANRLMRVALPFVLFLPLVHSALVSATLHAAETAVHPSALLALIRRISDLGDWTAPPPGTGHLWFLYYLMFFYVLLWVARAFGLGRFAARAGSLQPIWLLGALPLLLAMAMASVPAPHPAPESLLPQFWALGFYGAFFTIGYLMYGHPAIIDRCARYAPWLFVASALLYGVLFGLLWARSPTIAGGNASWPIALLEATVCVWMTIACFAFGQRLLDRRHVVLRYLADASYWTYIVHLPILFAIQYRLMDLDLHWATKFALSTLLTSTACLGSYQLLVRHTVLGRMLDGRTVARKPHVDAALKPD